MHSIEAITKIQRYHSEQKIIKKFETIRWMHKTFSCHKFFVYVQWQLFYMYTSLFWSIISKFWKTMNSVFSYHSRPYQFPLFYFNSFFYFVTGNEEYLFNSETVIFIISTFFSLFTHSRFCNQQLKYINSINLNFGRYFRLFIFQITFDCIIFK